MSAYRAPSGLRIGHIHLHVSNLKRSLAFYRDVLGFDVNVELPQMAFLSVDGYHHHIGLNTWSTAGVRSDHRPRPGLYHFALNYPERRDLARAVRQVLASGHALQSASDHTS